MVKLYPKMFATDLQITNEKPLEESVKKYIKKRLERTEKSDLIRSPFYKDIFYWDSFSKSEHDHLGHFFRMKRVRLMTTRHQASLLQWFEFLYT